MHHWVWLFISMELDSRLTFVPLNILYFFILTQMKVLRYVRVCSSCWRWCQSWWVRAWLSWCWAGNTCCGPREPGTNTTWTQSNRKLIASSLTICESLIKKPHYSLRMFKEQHATCWRLINRINQCISTVQHVVIQLYLSWFKTYLLLR